MQPKPAVSCDQPVGILKTFQGTAWQGCLIYVYIYYRRARGGHVRQICASGKRCIRHMKWAVVILELMFRGGHSRLHLWLCAESEKPKCSKQNIYNLIIGNDGGWGKRERSQCRFTFRPFLFVALLFRPFLRQQAMRYGQTFSALFLPLRISNNLQHRFRLTVWTGLRVSGSPSLSPSPAALSSFSSSLLFSGKFYLINLIILFVQLGAVVPLYVVPSGGQFWHRLCLLNAVEACVGTIDLKRNGI